MLAPSGGMTAMLSIDGTPVAFIGATRWYATPFLASLTSLEERTAIVALCDRMTARGPNAAATSQAPAEPAEPGQTRCTVCNCRTAVTPPERAQGDADHAPRASERGS